MAARVNSNPTASQQNASPKIVMDGNSSAHFGDVYYMGHDLPSLERQTDLKRKEILTALAFEAMNARQVQLAQGSITSLDWIWLDRLHGGPGFIEWLASGETTFWITGKPGSGKSTLMNFLSSNEKCKEYLKRKDQHDWLMLDFYFNFREGAQTANSLEGLLRSILYQFVQKSQLAAQAVQQHAAGPTLHIQSHAMDLNTLCSLIRTATSVLSATHSILVFIDGLDEFSGNYLHLIRMTDQLISNGVDKICLASRPEHMLHQFLVQRPHFAMHLYNYPTIEAYIIQSIEQASSLVDLAIDTQRLVRRLVKLSDGVMLWTRIVSESLLDSLLAGDTEEEVYDKMTEIPTELNETYKRLLGRIDSSKRVETALILHLLQTAIESPSPRDLQCLLAFLRDSNQLSCWPKRELDHKSFILRLRARTGSMIDIIPDSGTQESIESGDYDRCRVVLFHKTLSDHLHDSTWIRDILTVASPPIEPLYLWLRVCAQTLTRCKLSTDAASQTWDLLEAMWSGDTNVCNSEGQLRVPHPMPNCTNMITVAQILSQSRSEISGLNFLPYALWTFPYYLADAWNFVPSSYAYFTEILGSPMMLLHLAVPHPRSAMRFRDFCECDTWVALEGFKARLSAYSIYQRAALLALVHEKLLCAKYALSHARVTLNLAFGRDMLSIFMMKFCTRKDPLYKIQKPHVLSLITSVASYASDELVALRLTNRGGKYDADLFEVFAPHLGSNSGDRTLFKWPTSRYSAPKDLISQGYNIYLTWLYNEVYTNVYDYEMRGNDHERTLSVIIRSGLCINDPCSAFGPPLHTAIECSLMVHFKDHCNMDTVSQLRCLMTNGADPKVMHDGLTAIELARRRRWEVKNKSYLVPYSQQSNIHHLDNIRMLAAIAKLSKIIDLLKRKIAV